MNLATTFTIRNPPAGKTPRLTTRGRLPRARVLTLGLLLTAPLALAAGEGKPQAVSPGSPTTAEPLAESCPTFSWSGVAGAAGYELVLYQLSDRETLETTFQVRVAGDSRAWTPSAALCPASGSQYAWAVRAVTEEGVGAWSEAMLFETAGLPSDDEVRHALETLRRYQSGSDFQQPAAGAQPTAASQPPDPAAPTNRNPEPRTDLAALSAPTVGASPSPQTVSAPSSFSLNLSGDLQLGGFVFKGGTAFIHNDGGGIARNTAVGLGALRSVTPGTPDSSSGTWNSGFGSDALNQNTSGSFNTANGAGAMYFNATGDQNTATGALALFSNSSGYANTAIGTAALAFNDSGTLNTAIGVGALYSNIDAYRNTAIGFEALHDNTTGIANVAVGDRALGANYSGTTNTAIGSRALYSNTLGWQNTAIGTIALHANTGGDKNTAVGWNALSLGTGSNNTAVGSSAGVSWTTGNGNIAVGADAFGMNTDSGVIRIGTDQTATYIAGIHGTGLVTGTQVLVNSGNRLGVAPSSARFKRDIQDLRDARARVLDLRPVSFHYKDEIVDGGPDVIQYGLLAEEVFKVFPELVVVDEQGQPYTVRYQLLAPLLLAEIQRQQRELDELRRQLERGARKRSFR